MGPTGVLLVHFWQGAVVGFCVTKLILRILATRRRRAAKAAEKAKRDPGHWEAVPDKDGVMWRVRWSEPGKGGSYLYVRHYPASMKYSAESNAREFKQGRSPYEWECYRGIEREGGQS